MREIEPWQKSSWRWCCSSARQRPVWRKARAAAISARPIAALRAPETGAAYSSRYIGSLVADFHRTLLKGGVFLYPPTASHPSGKLRLLYEANPLALIAEQAGGIATDGDQPILNIIPKAIHQRPPLVIGGRSEVEAFSAHVPARSLSAV